MFRIYLTKGKAFKLSLLQPLLSKFKNKNSKYKHKLAVKLQLRAASHFKKQNVTNTVTQDLNH